ncbi:MAG: ribosome recycling factor, partial [Gemmatimonadota bacterium]
MTTSKDPLGDILRQARAHMDKAIESSRHEFSTIRSNKATTSLLDLVRVHAYGSEMPLNQVASVAAPEARLLTVTPWDRSLIQAIEKGIRECDLGLHPVTQGAVIRGPPPWTRSCRSLPASRR